jgi:hypothetical protein
MASNTLASIVSSIYRISRSVVYTSYSFFLAHGLCIVSQNYHICSVMYTVTKAKTGGSDKKTTTLDSYFWVSICSLAPWVIAID